MKIDGFYICRLNVCLYCPFSDYSGRGACWGLIEVSDKELKERLPRDIYNKVMEYWINLKLMGK